MFDLHCDLITDLHIANDPHIELQDRICGGAKVSRALNVWSTRPLIWTSKVQFPILNGDVANVRNSVVVFILAPW